MVLFFIGLAFQFVFSLTQGLLIVDQSLIIVHDLLDLCLGNIGIKVLPAIQTSAGDISLASPGPDIAGLSGPVMSNDRGLRAPAKRTGDLRLSVGFTFPSFKKPHVLILAQIDAGFQDLACQVTGKMGFMTIVGHFWPC
jgi:hypothetical protein